MLTNKHNAVPACLFVAYTCGMVSFINTCVLSTHDTCRMYRNPPPTPLSLRSSSTSLTDTPSTCRFTTARRPPPPPVKARPPRLQTQSPARDTNSFIPSPVYIFLIAVLLLLTLALTRTNNNNNNLAFPHIRAATTWAVVNATSIIPSEPPVYNKHTNLATFRGVHDTSATQRYRMMARCPDGMLCKDCYCGPSLCARLAGVMPLALQNNDGIACECFWTAFVNTSHCQFQMNLRCHH